MLHFRKMTLYNFGPYKNEQTIDFTDKAGVSIFWGNNGRGKTTLLNAFRYALFGVIQRRNGVLKNLSEMENTEAADNGKHGFYIVLEFKNDNDIYKLTRELRLRKGVSIPAGDEDYERVLFLEKNGSVLSPEERDHELNLIMPEQVSRFFLFDAELLQSYEDLLDEDATDGEQIKTAIEKILGLPVLQNGVIDIDDCLSKYETQKSSAAKDDDKTEKFGQELEALNANIEEHQNIISEKKAELSDLIAKKNILEGQMNETQKLRDWILQRKEAEKNKTKYEQDFIDVQSQIKGLMKTAWKGMLLTTVRDIQEKISEEKHSLETKKQNGKVAERFIKEMRKAIADRVCPVCEQEISQDVVSRLRERIVTSGSEFAGLSEDERERLYQLQGQSVLVSQIADGVTDVKSQIAMLEERSDRLQINIGEQKQLIDELKDNIERYGIEAEEADVLKISKDYSTIEGEIRELRRGITSENEKLEELKQNKTKILKSIDKLAKGDDYRIASQRYDLCHHLFQIFDESKAQYRERLKQNVEKDATDLFVQLTGDADYVGLRINDNYGLEIVHRSGKIVPGRSSGYEHIVALSLIGALHKNAPLRGPIIMDSPFGRLDPTHKANIVRTLPFMAEQSMLFAYIGEIDEQVARKELANHLIKEHKLERVASMHTVIK